VGLHRADAGSVDIEELFMTKDEELKQLIEDLISAMEYHVEQTRPIYSTTVALQAAKEALKAQPTPVPASWMEMVTANLVREGVNKHKARELAEHFYAKLKGAK
jgi:uncharacterized protein YejL (UPF0352 family)